MNKQQFKRWGKRHWPMLRRWSKRAFIGIGATIAFFIVLIFIIWLLFGRSRLTDPEDIIWGVTYSPIAAEDLKLDPKETYRAIVEDLKPQRLRLVAYWNRIEKNKGEYDFSELDRQVKLAENNQIPFMIAVGRRVPRYPECHTPEWAKGYSETDQHHKILKLIKRTMTRYDDSEQLFAWQIENEPFLSGFGICPPLQEKFLEAEIKLAHSLTDKKIVTTESGELSFWFKASKYPDILGTTLYRTVLLGKSNLAVRHIFPPSYYRMRSNLVKRLRGNIDNVIVAELQGEPWSQSGILNTSTKELNRTMNPQQFERNIEFTESVGFPEVYFWGVEWWFYELIRGNDYYWERASELFH